jgi:hypothetical protein
MHLTRNILPSVLMGATGSGLGLTHLRPLALRQDLTPPLEPVEKDLPVGVIEKNLPARVAAQG